nr:hypothetical protein [Tanacetum cinerariifolium]
MTSFGYLLNPCYAIKECLSCGALYTEDFCCSKGNVKDKILVPKPPKNCARYAKCGHPVNGPYCQGCSLLREKLEGDLVTYLKYFQESSESSNDSTNVVNAPREPFVVKKDHSVNPPHIDECCCECGAKLNMVTTVQQYLCCDQCGGPHETFQCQQVNFHDLCCENCGGPHENFLCQPKQEEKRIEEEQAAKARYWKIAACYDDEDDYDSAITPILSAEETDNSLSMRDEHLDTIPATESDEVIKSSVEDLVPIPSESEGILDTMCDVHLVNNSTPLEAKNHFETVINSNDDNSSSDDDSLYKENIDLEAAEIVISEEEEIKDDNLHEKLLNVHLLIANIEALKDNPTQSSELLTKSSSSSLNSLLEETNTFHNSLHEFENFYFDLREISSGSTTTHSDISLSDYEAFYFNNDHIKEISSGSTTTHSDISLSEYDSFIFDFSNEEFVDKLAHIISPPEYDRFYFWNLPDPGELMSVLNSGIHDNVSSTTRVNLPIEDDHSPLLAYVVWIFVVYLTYPVIPPYLHPFRNEDAIFDPGITINHFYLFKLGLSHRYGAFKKFNTHRSHLNEWPMIINGKNTHILDVLLFHLYPP